MRIAVYHNLPSGGAKRALFEWVKRLAPRHHLDLYSLGEAEHEYCDLRPYVAQHEFLPFASHTLFRSPFGRLNQFQRWRDLDAIDRLGRVIADQIDNQGYDVLFANPCRYTLIPTLLRYAKTPSVYYLHEPFGPSFQRAFRRPYIREEAWRRAANIVDPLPHLYWRKLYSLQRNSLLHTDLLLANSRFTQTQMYDDYGVTAPLCHYGVNLTDFRPLPDVAKGNHLLSVGALEPRKGFDFLVESLARIPAAERPPLSLACNEVDANERAYIEGIARQGGVELQILTNLSTSEMVLEYNKARLCVYSPVLEPLGLVPLEAMACGTPVIGVAEGGVSETVRDGETGLLVPRDPSAFAEAVRRLLSDPTTIDRFSAQAQAYVAREWSWDKSTALLESHLRSAAQHEFTALPTAIPETLQNVR